MRKITPIILAIILLIILLFPSIKTYQQVRYNNYYRGYGEDTHLTSLDKWGSRIFYGIDHHGNMLFFHFTKWGMYNKTLEAPEILGDYDPEESYLGDSVAYIGGVNGHIYYVDPQEGRIINIIDLTRLHIYFNATHSSSEFYGYYIIWGNRSGYFYVLFNNTIYYLYRDIKIIEKHHYNFTGFPVSAHRWNGGFVLKFGIKTKPWTHSSYKYLLYYVKEGRLIWNLTLPSRMYVWQSDAPDIYIYHNYIYHFMHNLIEVYRDGQRIGNFTIEGNVVSIKIVDDKILVFSYKGTKNLLLIYDMNFHLKKRVLLFDMSKIGIKQYSIKNQKVSIYKTRGGFQIFLYTCSMSNDRYPYLPMREILLDENLNIIWRNKVDHLYRSNVIYPVGGRNKFIIVTSEFENLYFVKTEEKTIIDPFAWLDVKVFVLVLILLFLAYVYIDKYESSLKRRRFEKY